MRRYIKSIALLLLLLIPIGGAWWFYRLHEQIHNSYAVWWVADMVIDHLHANSDQWPSSWEDLRDDYEIAVARSGRPWTFEELSSRVNIDWSANPQTFLEKSGGSERPAFKVITLKDGSDDHWGELEPNRIVLNYLRTHQLPWEKPQAQPTSSAGFR